MEFRNFLTLFIFFIIPVLGCSSKDHQFENNKTEELKTSAENVSAHNVAFESDKIVETKEATVIFKPFVVYKDKGYPNRFTPSGYMPNGECLKMDDAFIEMCQEGKSCVKVIYDIDCSRKSRNWAGVYWLNPPDNWGDRKGGYNLNGAERLTFWARGEKGGERIEEFKIGGVGRGMEFPDSDNAFIGPVILTKEWREYTIDLRGKDLSFISGGFAWVSNTDANPQACVFYLDNIQYQ